MINQDLTVKVAAGYQDIATATDPALCARVLALLLEHENKNPETPEQRLVRELEDKASAIDTQRYLEKARADKLEKELKELRTKFETAFATGPMPTV